MYIFKDVLGRSMVPRTLYESMLAEQRAVQKCRTPVDVDGIDGMDDFDYYHEVCEMHYKMASDRIEEMYLEEAA